MVLLSGLITAFCLLKGIAGAEEAKNPKKKKGPA